MYTEPAQKFHSSKGGALFATVLALISIHCTVALLIILHKIHQVNDYFSSYFVKYNFKNGFNYRMSRL
jgi:hypothetical protein